MGQEKLKRGFRPTVCILFIASLVFITLSFFAIQLLFSTHKYKTSNRNEDIYISQAAQNLPTNTSIFLWVMTTPQHHNTRIHAVNVTWLHRLEHAVVFTSSMIEDERIPYRTIFQGFDDSYEALFHKTRFGFYYAYKEISPDFDWYIKSDDDTYIVTENLKKYLKTLDPNKPIYAGFRLKPYLKHGYNSGSIYILSRAAMKIFAETLYNNSLNCPFDITEDLGIGRCLASANIYPIATRDAKNRGRFQMFNAYKTFMANEKHINFKKYYRDDHKKGFDEFSNDLISLHHMSPNDMLTADLFLYRVNTN